jgi:hypothetical protein
MDQLATLLEAERKQKALASRNVSTRHSRFGTTIKVQAVSRMKCMAGAVLIDRATRN